MKKDIVGAFPDGKVQIINQWDDPTQTPEQIARCNFSMGEDQGQIPEYLVNAIDTAREYKVSAEETAREFLRLLEAR